MITKMTDDLENISKLDDEPNDVGGLSASQLKAEFDKAGLTIQEYINNVLIPDIRAANIPTDSLTSADEAVTIPAGSVYDVLLALLEYAKVNGGVDIEGDEDGHGHVKLSDAVDSGLGVNDGTAATPLAVKTVNDAVTALLSLSADVESLTNAVRNLQVASGSVSSFEKLIGWRFS